MAGTDVYWAKWSYLASSPWLTGILGRGIHLWCGLLSEHFSTTYPLLPGAYRDLHPTPVPPRLLVQPTNLGFTASCMGEQVLVLLRWLPSSVSQCGIGFVCCLFSCNRTGTSRLSPVFTRQVTSLSLDTKITVEPRRCQRWEQTPHIAPDQQLWRWCASEHSVNWSDCYWHCHGRQAITLSIHTWGVCLPTQK